MVAGNCLNFSPFNECKARVKNPGFFLKLNGLISVGLCLWLMHCEHFCLLNSSFYFSPKITLALMDVVKPDEQTPIRELIPFGQMLDVFWFRSALHP